jgi:hypothetical protein
VAHELPRANLIGNLVVDTPEQVVLQRRGARAVCLHKHYNTKRCTTKEESKEKQKALIEPWAS